MFDKQLTYRILRETELKASEKYGIGFYIRLPMERSEP